MIENVVRAMMRERLSSIKVKRKHQQPLFAKGKAYFFCLSFDESGGDYASAKPMPSKGLHPHT
jgi:hypothetical protein